MVGLPFISSLDSEVSRELTRIVYLIGFALAILINQTESQIELAQHTTEDFKGMSRETLSQDDVKLSLHTCSNGETCIGQSLVMFFVCLFISQADP